MPHVSVPLCRAARGTPISVAYRVLGAGPVLVLMVPGMCVPGAMYDGMAAVLAATGQFTAVVLDNRAMGRSDAPPATLLGGPGYTAAELAADAWHVVDTVLRASGQFVGRVGGPGIGGEGAEGVKDGKLGDDVEGLPTWDAPLNREVALVGHSMGGMVVQAMMAQRPKRVRFVALLSTHGGGMWNLLPSIRMLKGMVAVAWSGFDRDVHATVNLGLHFTERFLDDWIEHHADLDHHDAEQHQDENMRDEKQNEKEADNEDVKGDGKGDDKVDDEKRMHEENEVIEGEGESEREPSVGVAVEKNNRHGAVGDEPSLNPISTEQPSQTTSLNDPDTTETVEEPPLSPPSPTRHIDTANGTTAQPCHESQSPQHPNLSNTRHNPADTSSHTSPHIHYRMGYFESKVVDLVRDAQIYFGLSASFRKNLWKPQKMLLETIAKSAKSAKSRRRARGRRRDIYHARYTGLERADPSYIHPKLLKNHAESTSLTNPEDSPYAFSGHAAVVRSHTMPPELAMRLRECTRIVKLVMAGRHDKVITPAASRALASSIGANTLVEVDAAHFITDEAASEVTTHIIYGLRKAFFAPNVRPCECSWCIEDGDGIAIETSTCRMC